MATSFDSERVRTIGDHLQVADYETRLVLDIYARVENNQSLSARVIGVPPKAQPKINKLYIQGGSYLTQDDEVLLEKHFAEFHDLHPGDSIDLTADGSVYKTYSVAGVVISPEYIWNAKSSQEIITSPDNFGVFFLAESELQDLSRVGNLVNELLIGTDFSDDVDRVASLENDLKSVIPSDIYVNSYTRAKQPANELLTMDLDGFAELSLFFPMLFLSITGFTISIMMTRLVNKQRRQIGVLKANGFSNGVIRRHYLTYGIVIGFVGAIGGVIIGLLLASTITAFYTGMLSIPIVVTQIRISTIFSGFVLALIACLVSVYFPANRAAKIKPADSLRDSVSSQTKKSYFIDRVFPLVRIFPLPLKIAIRNIDREKTRSLFTVTGVVFAMVLVIVSLGMLDSVEHMFNRMFNEVYKEDLMVTFKDAVSDEDRSRLKGMSGVEVFEEAMFLPVTVSYGSASYATALIALPSHTKMHGFWDVENRLLTFGYSSVFLGQGLQDELGIKEGDVVSLSATVPKVDVSSEGISIEELVYNQELEPFVQSLSYEQIEVPVTVSDFVNEPIGSMVYVSLDRLEDTLISLGYPPMDNTVYLTVKDGMRSEVRTELNSWSSVLQVQDNKVLYDMIQEMMTLFYAFIGVMLVFGGIMAFGLIFNTMTVSILERAREFATLRTLGFSNGIINLILTLENLLLTLIALPIGLILGRIVTEYALTSYNNVQFQFEVVVKPETFLLVSVFIVAVALVSQIPAMRWIAKIDLARMIKDRTS
jgi:putative ABC transport system permease protein